VTRIDGGTPRRKHVSRLRMRLRSSVGSRHALGVAELETQRQPVPRNDDSELDTALAFLGFARASVLKKAEGLDDELLRRRLVRSETTLIGLVRHLTGGERYWFAHTLAGVEMPDQDFEMDIGDLSTAAVLDDYRASIRESDGHLLALGDMDALTAEPVDGLRKTMRWVVAHMTSETARHAGHADILREQLDGVTGR
jgi:Protein of unknown function (DUF664)